MLHMLALWVERERDVKGHHRQRRAKCGLTASSREPPISLGYGRRLRDRSVLICTACVHRAVYGMLCSVLTVHYDTRVQRVICCVSGFAMLANTVALTQSANMTHGYTFHFANIL
jgi:hypothetical protein